MTYKRVTACALALLIAFGTAIVNMSTLLGDTEPNDDFANAEPLAPMTPVMGSVDAVDIDDYYQTATTADDQTVSATVYVSAMLTVNLHMYDEAQVEVDVNMSITDDYGVLFNTFSTVQTVYIRIEHVSGTGNYQLAYGLLDDIIKPNITHTPVTAAVEGQEINITAEVTDNVGVREVRLNYTGVDGVAHNETMLPLDDNYTYHIPGQASGGDVFYFIWANDTSDPSLENRTSNYTITVSEDTEPPTITHTPVTDAEAIKDINIHAQVTDNAGVAEVRLNYTDVDGVSHNETMTIVGGNYSFDIPAQVSGGTVTYFIWVNDTNGNVARTADHVIDVTADVSAPTISHDPVTKAEVGKSIEITAIITDDSGVDSATLYYRMAGGTTFSSLAMTKSDDNYTATIPAAAVTLDGLEYYISATDGFNTATFPDTDPTTSPLQIEVSEEKEDELPWMLIIIVVLIVVIVVIIAGVARRKGPTVVEEEEFEPMEETTEETIED